MRPTALVLVLALASFAAACKGKKKPAADPADEAAAAAAKACSSNADCTDDWVCLARKCTDPASGAILTDPSNAVTPRKVQQQLEQQAADRAADVDKALDP